MVPAGKLFDMAMKGSCGATGIIRAQGTDIEPPAKNTEARLGEDDFSPEVMQGQPEVLLSPYQKGVPAGVHKRDGKSVPAACGARYLPNSSADGRIRKRKRPKRERDVTLYCCIMIE